MRSLALRGGGGEPETWPAMISDRILKWEAVIIEHRGMAQIDDGSAGAR